MENEWKNMLVVGPPPKSSVFMKPEYREPVKNGLKQSFPELFDTITVETSKEYGTIFRSDIIFLYFTKVGSDDSIDLQIEYWIPEKIKWMDHYTYLQEIGQERYYSGDPYEEVIIDLLKDVYESNKDSTLETLTLKRSEIGWNDPITFDPVRSGDEIIRINKDNRFIFQRKALEKSWAGAVKKNPLTNQPVTPEQIEKFIANVTEDAGAEPTGGRRKRRRKTLRRKNLRSSRKNK